MKPWTIYGITQKLTENFKKTKEDVKHISPAFKRSLHIFHIDVGNDNELNLEMAALSTPQYNIHRFGIFFADSPRHTDLLFVLGKCSKKMVQPLKETINQIPKPFGIVLIEDKNSFGISLKELSLPNVIAYYDRKLDADKILSVLLNIMEDKQ